MFLGSATDGPCGAAQELNYRPNWSWTVNQSPWGGGPGSSSGTGPEPEPTGLLGLEGGQRSSLQGP